MTQARNPEPALLLTALLEESGFRQYQSLKGHVFSVSISDDYTVLVQALPE